MLPGCSDALTLKQRSPSATLLFLCVNDDTAHKTTRLTIELQCCKEEVKTRKITAKLALRKYVEIKCQHVMVVKRRWRLPWLTAFEIMVLLRHMQQFCSTLVAFILCSETCLWNCTYSVYVYNEKYRKQWLLSLQIRLYTGYFKVRVQTVRSN